MSEDPYRQNLESNRIEICQGLEGSIIGTFRKGSIIGVGYRYDGGLEAGVRVFMHNHEFLVDHPTDWQGHDQCKYVYAEFVKLIS